MVIVQELIRGLATLVTIFFTILYWLLVARIVLSWFGVNPITHTNELLNVVFQITDAILAPFRRLPLQIGGIDLSPIVAFFVLQFTQRILLVCLYSLARGAA
jgi:YggT family protein